LPFLARFPPFRCENPEVFHQDRRVQVPLLSFGIILKFNAILAVVTPSTVVR
jgi:hypothetical protein